MEFKNYFKVKIPYFNIYNMMVIIMIINFVGVEFFKLERFPICPIYFFLSLLFVLREREHAWKGQERGRERGSQAGSSSSAWSPDVGL